MLHILLEHFKAFYQQNILFAFARFFARAKQPAKMPDFSNYKISAIRSKIRESCGNKRPNTNISISHHFRRLGFVNLEELWRLVNAVNFKIIFKGFVLCWKQSISEYSPFVEFERRFKVLRWIPGGKRKACGFKAAAVKALGVVNVDSASSS